MKCAPLRLPISILLAFVLLLPCAALAAEPAPSEWARADVKAADTLKLLPPELKTDYQQPATRAEFACAALWFLAVQYGYNPSDDLDGFLNDYCERRTDRNGDLFLMENYLIPENAVMTWSTLFGNRPDTIRVPFEDTAEHPLRQAIHAAYVFGLVNGRGDGTFGPDDPITRQEAAVMLTRAYQVCGGTLPDGASSFADGADIGDWAMPSVDGMAALGVMEGVGDGLFAPAASYSREQCAVTFLRLYRDAPVGRLQGNLPPLYSYEEQLDRILNPEGFLLLDTTTLEGNTCTVICGRQEGRHGSYWKIYLLYPQGYVTELLHDLPTHPWSGSFAPPTDLALEEEGTVLTFTITMETDGQVEFQTVWPKGVYHYRVDLATGAMESVRTNP